MHKSRQQFHRNKIAGAIAEAACRQHFEAVGYTVEPFGIEHTAPSFCAVKNVLVDEDGANWNEFAPNVPKYPDFIISRTIEADKPKREGYFVEVKFQSTFNPKELQKQWKGYPDFNEHPFYMYVVVRNPEPAVYLRYYKQKIWYTVEQITANWMQSFAPASNHYLDFKQAYDLIVKPSLDAIFA